MPPARLGSCRLERPSIKPTVGVWLESHNLRSIASYVASHYGLSPQDLPDLLQELRIALWKAGLDTRVNATWVFRTASHKAVDFLKWRTRVADERTFWKATVARPVSGDPELWCLLRACAARLPPRLREFFFLRYEKGLSEREIARRLGLCRNSVRWMDRRCLQIMKGGLGSSGRCSSRNSDALRTPGLGC